MVKFVCLFLVVACLAHSGFSLKCYECESEKLDGCLKSKKPSERPCGNPRPGFKEVCYYTVNHNIPKNKDYVKSTCTEIEAGKDDKAIHECVSNSTVAVKECVACTTDLCNSGPVLSASMAVLCLPFMYLITKLF